MSYEAIMAIVRTYWMTHVQCKNVNFWSVQFERLEWLMRFLFTQSNNISPYIRSVLNIHVGCILNS